MVKKKGERYRCEECGLVVLVEEPCGCESCGISCCEQPMKQVKSEPKSKSSKTLKKK